MKILLLMCFISLFKLNSLELEDPSFDIKENQIDEKIKDSNYYLEFYIQNGFFSTLSFSVHCDRLKKDLYDSFITLSYDSQPNFKPSLISVKKITTEENYYEANLTWSYGDKKSGDIFLYYDEECFIRHIVLIGDEIQINIKEI